MSEVDGATDDAAMDTEDFRANFSNIPGPEVTPAKQEVNNNNDEKTQLAKNEIEQELEEEDEKVRENDDPDCTVYGLESGLRVFVSSPEEWLCVARLPLDLTEEELKEILQEFGKVEKMMLIHSERTGKFKGYALVLYASKSSSLQARHVLEGHEVKGHSLDCDWLRTTTTTTTTTSQGSLAALGQQNQPFISLHSKCLYVDRLPPNYRDMGEFRRLFSTVVNPPYCQIAMKNGVLQNWGLVEFALSEEAELTLERLDGLELQGQKMRVQYCIPGVHAINVYMSFVNNPMDAVGERKALLEETPSTKVYDQLQSLAKQNPWFVQSLQNIMSSSSPDCCPPPPSSSLPPSASSADPAQAALILLLASRVTAKSAPPAQTAALMQGIVRQLEEGAAAADILRQLAREEEDELGCNGGDLGSIISALVRSAQAMLRGPNVSVKKDPNKKDPKLMDLLFKSFQARVKNGIYSPPAAAANETNRSVEGAFRKSIYEQSKAKTAVISSSHGSLFSKQNEALSGQCKTVVVSTASTMGAPVAATYQQSFAAAAQSYARHQMASQPPQAAPVQQASLYQSTQNPYQTSPVSTNPYQAYAGTLYGAAGFYPNVQLLPQTLDTQFLPWNQGFQGFSWHPGLGALPPPPPPPPSASALQQDSVAMLSNELLARQSQMALYSNPYFQMGITAAAANPVKRKMEQVYYEDQSKKMKLVSAVADTSMGTIALR